MSFGRTPFYIYEDADGISFHGNNDTPHSKVNVFVPREAMAQFIASLASRGTETLQEWIDLGKKVRTPGAIPESLTVQVSINEDSHPIL